MGIRIIYFIAVLGISLSSKHYGAEKAAKMAWKQARRDGEAAESKMVFVITPDGKEIGRKTYSFSVECKRGYTIDKILGDGSFTCKKGPGNGKGLRCKSVYGTIYSIKCPGFMYVNSFWTEGTAQKIRCCGERHLKYSEGDCDVYESTNDANQQVAEGKFWIGFSTNAGGIRWNNTQCGYTVPLWDKLPILGGMGQMIMGNGDWGNCLMSLGGSIGGLCMGILNGNL